MKPIVKNIEIICLYNIRSRVCIKIVKFLSPTKFERFQQPIKTTEQRKIRPLSMTGSITFGVPFQDLLILEAVEF